MKNFKTEILILFVCLLLCSFNCVGIYDFQIVDDANIALDSLANVKRTHPWKG